MDLGTRVQFPPPPLSGPLAITRKWAFFIEFTPIAWLLASQGQGVRLAEVRGLRQTRNQGQGSAQGADRHRLPERRGLPHRGAGGPLQVRHPARAAPDPAGAELWLQGGRARQAPVRPPLPGLAPPHAGTMRKRTGFDLKADGPIRAVCTLGTSPRPTASSSSGRNDPASDGPWTGTGGSAAGRGPSRRSCSSRIRASRFTAAPRAGRT